MVKTKLVTRYQISLPNDQNKKPLEKSIVVAEKGMVKTKKGSQIALRPMMSQYTVWLEGKKYYTQLKTLVKQKSLEITMDSPESRWKGRKVVRFPKGINFCYFSQIAECIAHSGILNKIISRPHTKVPVTVIWDNYPYLLEQFTNIQDSVFVNAEVYLDEEEKKLYRVSVDLSGQSIFYHFSKKGELVKMSWVGQGVTIMSPSEAARLSSDSE